MAPLEKVEEIIQANQDVIVIVDEAYVDFGGVSALPLVEKYENLLVVQTFSKSRSMAGLRIGFCIGNEKLIQYMNDVKFSFNSYTMNKPSQLLGVEAVRDDAYFKETVAKIIATREWTKQELKALGFTCVEPGGTFYIFPKALEEDAKVFIEKAKKYNLILVPGDSFGCPGYFRMAYCIDTEKVERSLDALKEFVEKEYRQR